MAHLSAKNIIYSESSQEFNNSDNALDTVVDPCTEFEIKKEDKSPNEAFNLPKNCSRRQSLTLLRGKPIYKVNEHELPGVHRSSSSQSVTSMLKKENYSESSDVSIRNFQEDTVSIGSISSDVLCKGISFQLDSPVSPHYNFVNDRLERLETASNISLTSNLTDIPGSNISSLSDVTGYEEELFQIKRLLNHGSTQSLYRPENVNTNASLEAPAYVNKIEELQSQLQETLAENERYKFNLKDLENKIELIWQEKFQELLRQKAQCEGQLENVRKQYENTLNEKEKILDNFKHGHDKNSLREEFANLQSKLNYLEKQNSDLQSRLILSSNESKQWQTEFLKTESDNEKLRITLQELKSEIDSKNNVLFGLKNKITEQHIEIQSIIQAKLKLNNHIASLNNDIEAVKKSEKWYIDQLHACQMIKSNIQQELMSTQTNLITATQKIESVKMEVAHWKNICEETQRKAMREKEKLLRKVEMIEADILEREAILKCTQTENGTQIEMNYVSKPVDDSQDHDYQIILQDYEDQLSSMKKIIGEQNTTIDNLHKQSSDYLVRLTTLQKTANEKEIKAQILENRNEDLEMKCNTYSENVRSKDNELLELKNKIVNLEVALHAANREKREIDEVVKNVREDFTKFMKCYQTMKEKLEEKTKIITQFEKEKQDMFMENNWKVCEIEELQQKLLNLKSLQAELVELKNTYNHFTIQYEEMQQQNSLLKRQNEILEADCDNLKAKIEELENLHHITKISSENTKDITNLENEIVKLNETLKIRENQLVNQTKNCEILNNDILEKDTIIYDLQSKLTESVNSIEIGNNISTNLEEINLNLNSKIKDLNKKLIDANIVIDQFNTLCRNSEQEKSNLSNELNLLKTKLESFNSLSTKITENEEINKNFVDSNIQTDFSVDSVIDSSNLENIKLKLSQLLADNNNVSNNQSSESSSDNIKIINEYLSKIISIKENQMRQLETSEKVIKVLKAKLTKLKSKTEKKMCYLTEKCAKLDKNYEQVQNIVQILTKQDTEHNSNSNSISIQTDFVLKDQTTHLIKEIKDLKTLLRVTEMERKEQYKRYETNNRTLLKKVKEHMKGRKVTERKLFSLEETYNYAITEINNSKIINNRLDLELKTYKTRCEEYKLKCDKLNEDILQLEKQKNENVVEEKIKECLNCLDKEQLNRQLQENQYKYKNLEERFHWYEKEISDKEQGITECKKQLFNEKLQVSALKKQLSSIQMCLNNANDQLDNNQIEFGHLKTVIEKLEINEKLLTDQLENAHIQYQECKRKLESALRSLEEKTANNEILADEIKTLSCHLHQKTLEMSNLENKFALFETQTSTVQNNHEKLVDELHINLAELQDELNAVRNDKFFLQRLCADLKMSLQGTLNQNKVLKIRLESLENETKHLTEKLQDSLPSIPSPSRIDEDYINRLLQQSTVLPNKPLKNLRSCLDSLKHEMATLQKEIIAKTQTDISL